MLRRLAPLLLLLLLGASPAPERSTEFGTIAEHPSAISLLELDFGADDIRIGLRMQELTLREVPRWLLDTDLSGTISNFEFEQAWGRIAAMIEETLWLEFDGQVVYPEFEIEGYEGIGETHLDGSYHFEYVQLRATIKRPKSLDAARIHSDLFLEDGNPKHRLMIEVVGIGTDPIHTLLMGSDRDYDFEIPSALTVLGLYTELGWEHVLEGFDHLAFLIALLFGVICWKDLLGAVTAFTLAHSITLALAAMDVFSLPPAVVEPGIAFSVLAVLAWHLRRGAADARPWIPAFAFGLLHGFGFAGVLQDIGLPPGERASSLFGFNLGVELGQLTFVLPVVLIMVFLRKITSATTQLKLREFLALPALAFAMYLVGGAAVKFWFAGLEGLPARAVILAIGAGCAAIFCLLPCAHQQKLQVLRRLTWQAALLLMFFHVGQQLQVG